MGIGRYRKLDQAWGYTEPHRDKYTSHDDDLRAALFKCSNDLPSVPMENLKFACSELRYSVRVKHMLDFKNLIFHID